MGTVINNTKIIGSVELTGAKEVKKATKEIATSLRILVQEFSKSQKHLERTANDFNKALNKMLGNKNKKNSALGGLISPAAMNSFKTGKKYLNAFSASLGTMGKSATVSEAVINSLSSAFTKIKTVMKIGTGVVIAVGAAFTVTGYAMKSYMQQVISVTERMRGYNIALLATMKTQSAANNLMNTALKVAEDLPIAYDQVFSSIKAYSLINPLRPMLQDTRNLEKNLKEINGITLALSQIEPEWGIQGAIFSLREALSGDLRSLKRRFEIPVDIITTADGERLTDVKNQPTKVVKALSRYFQDIFGTEALEATSRQFGVVLAKIEGYYKQFLNMIGSAGAYDKIVGDIIKARDVIQKFVNSDSAKAYAKRFSDAMIDMWNQTRKIIDGIGNGLNTLFGSNIDFADFEAGIELVADGMESYLLVYQRVANFISDQRVWDVLKDSIDESITWFQKMGKVVYEEVMEMSKSLADITKSIDWVWKKLKDFYDWTKKVVGESKAQKGLLILLLFGPVNVISTLFAVGKAISLLVIGIGYIGGAATAAFGGLILQAVAATVAVDAVTGAFTKLKDYLYGDWVNSPFGKMIDMLNNALGKETSASYKFENSPMRGLIEEFNTRFDLVGKDKLNVGKLLKMDHASDEFHKLMGLIDTVGTKADKLASNWDKFVSAKPTQERFMRLFEREAMIEDYELMEKVAKEQGRAAEVNDKLSQKHDVNSQGFWDTVTKRTAKLMSGGTNNLGKFIPALTDGVEASKIKMEEWANSLNDMMTGAADNTKNLATEIKSLNEIKMKGVFAGKEQEFIKAANKYGVDPMLLMAIAQHETGYGTSKMVREKNNPGGIMDWDNNWETGRIFKTLEDGIDFTAKNLKKNYIDKGLTTIAQIGPKYAPVGAGNDPKNLNQYWNTGVGNMINNMGGDASDVGPAGNISGKIAILTQSFRDSKDNTKTLVIEVSKQQELMNQLTASNKEFEVNSRLHDGSIDSAMNSLRKVSTNYDKMLKEIETDTGITGFGPAQLKVLEEAQETQFTNLLDSKNRTMKHLDDLLKLGSDSGIDIEARKRDLDVQYKKTVATATAEYEKAKKEILTRQRSIAFQKFDPKLLEKFGLDSNSRFKGGFQQEFTAQALDDYSTVKVLDFDNSEWDMAEKVVKSMLDNVKILNMTLNEAAKSSRDAFIADADKRMALIQQNISIDLAKAGAGGMTPDMMKEYAQRIENIKNIKKETEQYGVIVDKTTERIKEAQRTKSPFEEYTYDLKQLNAEIANLNFMTSNEKWQEMFGKTGMMDRATKTNLFTAYEKSLEMAPKPLGESFDVGIQKAINSFQNNSEIMLEGANNLATDMAGAFETGFFDLFNGNVKNMADVFAGVGKSIMNTISKIISKMISTSLTKMIFNVDINANGSSSGGGIMGMLGGLTGGGSSDNSGGFMNNVIGSVSKMFSGGGKSSGGSILSQLTSSVFGGGKAAKKSGGLFSNLFGGKGTPKGGMLKGINVPALGAMAAVSFLTQPGRLFGGTVDHTGPGKEAFASLQEKQKSYKERRVDDALKYAGASSSGNIRGWMPGAIVGRNTSSGDGIFSKKTKGFEVDYSAFNASLEGFYKMLESASTEHYQKMYELQKIQEKDQLAYLKEEQMIQLKKISYLQSALKDATKDQDWEAVDKYRDQYAESNIAYQENLDAQRELKRQRRFRRDEFNQQRKNLFGGSNEIENASAMLAIQRERNADLVEGTIAWYDSQMSLLETQQGITTALKDLTEQARKTMVSDSMMLVRGKSGSYGKYSSQLSEIRSEQLRAAGGGSDLDGLKAKYKQFFTSNQNNPSGFGGYSPQYDLEGLQKYLAEEGTAIERAIMLESAKSNNADAYANIFREGLDISLDELTKTKDKMKEVANIISASKDPELISELSLFYEELNSSVISSLSGLAEQFKMMFQSGLLEGNMDIDTLRDLPNEILTSIIDTFKSDQFTGGLTNKLSGLETGDNDLVRSVITDLSKFDETKGVRDEYAKLSTRLDSNEDPWEVWYDYQEDTIRTKIRNSIEGNDDYYAAQDELFDLLLEKAKRVDQKAEDAFDSLEKLFEDMNETAKLRLAEERKTNKGDVFYIDAMSTGLDPYTINDLKNKLKNGDKDAAGLLSEIRRKVLGTSK